MTDDLHTAISKEMSFVLRHQPPPSVDPLGFVPLADVASCLSSRPSSFTILAIVARDLKQRFQLGRSASGAPTIRATQGHSFPLAPLAFRPVRAVPPGHLALHATSGAAWRRIQETGELRRMRRTHVHLACLPRHLRRDAWAEVLLAVDVASALRSGVEFVVADNGVLLTEGPVPAALCHEVRWEELPPCWRDGDEAEGSGRGSPVEWERRWWPGDRESKGSGW